eukprot:6196855-Pleurochrysis_carterae.AAC.3
MNPDASNATYAGAGVTAARAAAQNCRATASTPPSQHKSAAHALCKRPPPALFYTQLISFEAPQAHN